MNKLEYLLVCIGEEGAEIAQAASKAARFGLDDRHMDDTPTARQHLVNELNDLMGLVRIAVELGVIPKDWQSDEQMDCKRTKFLKYLTYSEKVKSTETPHHLCPICCQSSCPGDCFV